MEWISVKDRLPQPGKPVWIHCVGQLTGLRAVWIPQYFASTDNYGDYEGDVEFKDGDEDTAYLPSGWYEWNGYEDMHWQVGHAPTAWMPLPKAPALQEEAK